MSEVRDFSKLHDKNSNNEQHISCLGVGRMTYLFTNSSRAINSWEWGGEPLGIESKSNEVK